MLFLFSDVLLVARKKSYMDFGSPPRYEVVDWAKRSYICVNEQAKAENEIYMVLLENQGGKRIEMVLVPPSQNELTRWTSALNPPSLSSTGESIYETWDCPQYYCSEPYNAQQPDELTIDVGDVMKVMKKTSDGSLGGSP
uniref:PH domain-containing protein n=1 Tax=Ciona savignyi TaxID=51511 RepID=H2YNG7_CIOSA